MCSWEECPHLIKDLEAFVAKIVRNKKTEFVRRIRLRFEREVLTADPEQFITTNWAFTESLEEEEFTILANRQEFRIHGERLYSALMKLDAVKRDAIILRYMGEWSVNDIAKTQGVSTRTVYSRSEQGLTFLRKMLCQVGTEREMGVDKQNDPGRRKRRSPSNPRGP